MKKNKSKFKNVEDRIEDTDKKLCEFKSLIEQIKTRLRSFVPTRLKAISRLRRFYKI
jgi:hypothetical protein